MARPLNISFGEAVREIRQKQGVSQEELGFRAGLHRNHVGEIERAEMSPTLDTIAALAEALQTTPSALVSLAENRASDAS